MRKWFNRHRVKTPDYRIPGDVAPLTDEERADLKQIVNGPLFRRALAVIHTKRPPVAGRMDPEQANQRYHELLGWNEYETALINVWREPRRQAAVVEKYQAPKIQ